MFITWKTFIIFIFSDYNSYSIYMMLILKCQYYVSDFHLIKISQFSLPNITFFIIQVTILIPSNSYIAIIKTIFFYFGTRTK